jgi:hypothetical protein
VLRDECRAALKSVSLIPLQLLSFRSEADVAGSDCSEASRQLIGSPLARTAKIGETLPISAPTDEV